MALSARYRIGAALFAIYELLEERGQTRTITFNIRIDGHRSSSEEVADSLERMLKMIEVAGPYDGVKTVARNPSEVTDDSL